MRGVLGRVLRAYSRVLSTHKYATQMVTGGVLWCAGDALCQTLVGTRADGRDWARTARMALYGTFLSAPTCAFWYSFLERYSQRMFAAQAPGSSLAVPLWLRRRFAKHPVLMAPVQRYLMADDSHVRLRTWKIITFKLAMDTAVFDPLYLALFFTASSLMEGLSAAEVAAKLQRDLLRTWLVDITVWTPIQTANFRFVPVLYQALVVQSCNIGWNAYLSFVQHQHQRHERHHRAPQ